LDGISDILIAGNWDVNVCVQILPVLGWIAVTFGEGETCRFQAWTPGGRGVYLRSPALLPFAVAMCGPKVRHSPAYRKGKGMLFKHV
jgi:hypothetical protein